MENKKAPLSSLPNEFGKILIFWETRQQQIRYIQNALISAKDHQKREFDLDEAVSYAILYNYQVSV